MIHPVANFSTPNELTNYLQHLMGDKLLHGKGCGIDEVLYRVLPTKNFNINNT